MFREEILAALGKALKRTPGEIALEAPPHPEMGDFAFPCFSLAKEEKKAPALIAQDIAQRLKSIPGIARIEAKGPYVNFFVDKALLGEVVLTTIAKEKGQYGRGKEKRTVLVEFPGPNTNKPLHLGHVRNMLLGESISRIFEKLGNKVVRVDIVNDRGIHVCKSMLAYQKWGEKRTPDKKSDHFVGDFYVLYAKNETPDLTKEAQDLLLRWEAGDRETIALWKKMTAWAISGFHETYKRMGITQDKVYYESEMYLKGKEVVFDGFRRGVFTKDKDGNVIADLEKQGLPNKVLLRADGTSVYVTQDLYLSQKRYEDYRYDACIYVVGNEQNLQFKQLFAILDLLGFKPAKHCYHLSYGMVNLPEGKMKSREGTVVDADDLMDEVIAEARAEVKERHDLKKAEIEKRATTIGMGGLKFFVLKYDPAKDFTFNPKESIAFEGETGPYVQYVHARISSILKNRKGKPGKVDFTALNTEQERIIVKHLMDYPDAIEGAAKECKPSAIAHYLLSLAQAFNNYYHSTPVLKAGKRERDARLLLIACVAAVVKDGLYLLGIDAPDEM